MESRRNSLEIENLNKQNLISKQIYLNVTVAARNGDGYEIGSSEMENRQKHQLREHVDRRDTNYKEIYPTSEKNHPLRLRCSNEINVMAIRR